MLEAMKQDHQHHEAVIYMDGEISRLTPDVLIVEPGDDITYFAVGADFQVALPDVFTVATTGRFRVRQDGGLKLVVRDDAEPGVHHYEFMIEMTPMMKAADPTIIIHGR